MNATSARIVAWAYKWSTHLLIAICGTPVVAGSLALMLSRRPPRPSAPTVPLAAELPADPCDAEIVKDLRSLPSPLDINYYLPYSAPDQRFVSFVGKLQTYAQYTDKLALTVTRNNEGLGRWGIPRLTAGRGLLFASRPKPDPARLRPTFAAVVRARVAAAREDVTKVGWVSSVAAAPLSDKVL